MEYNMSEAKKAMDNAEKKITENKFSDAIHFALTAQTLYPELDGVKQLVMMIAVHISAAKTVGEGVTDLYGILGVNHLATYEVMKKQFRELLLALHPDKNKNKGVEACCRGAYELIVKAWNILSDKDKRLEYNRKCGFEAGQGLEATTHVGVDVGSSSRARSKRGRSARQDVGSSSRARPKHGCPAREDVGYSLTPRPNRGRPNREDVCSGPIANTRNDVGSSSGPRPMRGRPAATSRGRRSKSDHDGLGDLPSQQSGASAPIPPAYQQAIDELKKQHSDEIALLREEMSDLRAFVEQMRGQQQDPSNP